DADLRRTLLVRIAIVADEDMGGQIIHFAAAFGAADRRAPTMLSKGIGEATAQHIGGVHPAVIVVRHRFGRTALVLRSLFEAELLDRLRRLAVRQTGEHARHRQRDEPGVLALAEAPPL